MALVPPHTHQFLIPTATPDQVSAGTRDDLAITPAGLSQADLTAKFATAQQGANADFALSIVETLAMPAGEPFPPVTDLVLGQTVVPIAGGYATGVISDVHLNGSQLVSMLDYVAFDGANIILMSAITEADLPAVLTGQRVTTVAGLTGLDNRYIRRDETGVDAGDVVRYENFDGAGLQSLRVKDEGRLWIKKDNALPTDFTDVWVTRTIRADTPGLGVTARVSSALRIEETIRKPIDSFEWALVINLLYQPEVGAAARAGEHCAFYPRVEKRGDGRVWAACFEYRDFTTNPTAGSVNMEIGCGATGPDPNNQRIGIHMVIGSANDTMGENIVSDGIAIFAHPGYAQSKRHIRLQGQGKVGIDMREMDTVYSNTGIAMATNQFIKWADTINDDINTPSGMKGGIGFSSTNDTIAFSGVRGQFGAPTPDRTVFFEFGGVLHKIPASLA